MIFWTILRIALVVLPVILTVDLYPLLYTVADFREAKEILALLFSGLLIGIWLNSRPKDLKIPLPLIAVLCFCFYRLVSSPLFSFPLLNHSHTNSIWQYKTFTWILTYSLLFVAISNTPLGICRLEKIFSTISWVSLFVAGYCVLQYFGFDQWQKPLLSEEFLNTPSHEMTGTLTHVTLAMAFLLFSIPIFLYRQQYWRLGVVLGVILLGRSDMAFLGLAGIFILAGVFYRRWSKAIVIGLCFMVLLFGWANFNKLIPRAGERISLWSTIIQDIKHSPLEEGRTYALTGYGLGSYRYIFTSLHTTTQEGETRWIKWETAHNEYLEWFYDTGFVGLFLGLWLLFYLLKKGMSFIIPDIRRVILLCMLVGTCVCAMGTFVWHVEPLRFYSVVVAGLLQNYLNKEDV